MRTFSYLLVTGSLVAIATARSAAEGQAKNDTQAGVSERADKPPQRPLHIDPPHISTDKAIKYDYDIIYVRAPRVAPGKKGKEQSAPVWPNAAEPTNLRASTDLMLLHPDGSEEVLVAGGKGAIADPYVSFDAKWVYYSY